MSVFWQVLVCQSKLNKNLPEIIRTLNHICRALRSKHFKVAYPQLYILEFFDSLFPQICTF